MTQTVDAKRAFELLDNAVAAKGEEHTVDECRYFVEQEPFCIVGHVLAETGITAQDFEDNDGEFSNTNGQSFESIYEKPFIQDKVVFSPEAAGILNIAQRMQDHGKLSYEPSKGLDKSWGNAVRVAREWSND